MTTLNAFFLGVRCWRKSIIAIDWLDATIKFLFLLQEIDVWCSRVQSVGNVKRTGLVIEPVDYVDQCGSMGQPVKSLGLDFDLLIRFIVKSVGPAWSNETRKKIHMYLLHFLLKKLFYKAICVVLITKILQNNIKNI